jgi:hypothetical protein
MADSSSVTSPTARTDHTSDHLLAVYLRNHDAGAVGGVRRFATAARSHRDQSARAELGRLRAEVEQDHGELRHIMQALAVRPSRTQQLLVMLGERVGRFKPNGRLLGRSPLTDVVEVEALILGVTGKLRLWHTLMTLAPRKPGVEVVDLEVLRRRAVDQLERLERLHQDAVHSWR